MKIINAASAISHDFFKIARREINYHTAKPITGVLFLTYRCNSRCQTCSLWKRPHAEEIAKEIGLQEWQNIIDELIRAGVRIFEIFGGNVLLRKDLLIPLLRYIKKQKCIIHMPTNQIGLDEELMAALIENVDFIYLSTDGIGEKQDQIRGLNGASSNVENTITTMQSLKNGKIFPRLICNTTVSRFNYDILGELIDYAAKLKFDEIHLEYSGEFYPESIDRSLIDGLRPDPYYITEGKSILVDAEGARMVKQQIKEIKRKYKYRKDIHITSINIDSRSARSLSTGLIPHKKCYCERTEATVDPSGNLVACPFIHNYVHGNLLNASFEQVWNNEAHKIFHHYQKSGQIDMCKNCILGVQRNPGILKSIERIYHSRIAPKLVS